MKRRSTLSVRGAVIGAIVLASPFASASHYDSMFKTANYSTNCSSVTGTTRPQNHWFCQTDNATLMWYDEVSITAGGRSNINSTLEDSFEATDLNVDFQYPPSYDGCCETDIIFRKVTLPSGTLGEAWCQDADSTTLCDQHYVDFAMDTPETKLVCHEAGHAVGLTHGADASPAVSDGADSLGCMQRPYSEVPNHLLGSHNSAQINATY